MHPVSVTVTVRAGRRRRGGGRRHRQEGDQRRDGADAAEQVPPGKPAGGEQAGVVEPEQGLSGRVRRQAGRLGQLVEVAGPVAQPPDSGGSGVEVGHPVGVQVVDDRLVAEVADHEALGSSSRRSRRAVPHQSSVGFDRNMGRGRRLAGRPRTAELPRRGAIPVPKIAVRGRNVPPAGGFLPLTVILVEVSRVGPSPLTRGERPASIRATVVKRTATGFVAVTGWAFNNLTYLGVAGPAWAINPLARTGTYTSAGRLWSTTCTPNVTAGPRTCRTFVWATVYGRTAVPAGGYTSWQRNQWMSWGSSRRPDQQPSPTSHDRRPREEAAHSGLIPPSEGDLGSFGLQGWLCVANLRADDLIIRSRRSRERSWVNGGGTAARVRRGAAA